MSAAAAGLRPKITTEILLVTPAMAEKWLEGKAHNRPIHDSHVQKFERLLQTGDFHLTHQGVAFDVDNRLIDGQHRLWAILNSGIAAEMMVSHGWPVNTQQFVDQGLIRTSLDVIKLRDPGTVATSYMIAVARRMQIGTRGTLLLTIHDVVHFAEEHTAALTFAVQEALQNKRPRYVAPAGVGAAIARAFYHEDKHRLTEFGGVMLGSRMPQGDEDSGAHVLREWLLSGSPIYGAVRVSKDLLTYMKAQRALMAFLNREKIRNLYPQQDEIWSLPGEQRRQSGRGSLVARKDGKDVTKKAKDKKGK